MSIRQPFTSLDGLSPNSGHLDRARQREHIVDVLTSRGYTEKQAWRSARRIVRTCSEATRR